MKTIDNLTSEELMEKLGETPADPVKDKRKTKLTVRNFIREFGLVSGLTKVPTYMIYWYYKSKHSGRGTKLHKIEFFREFKNEFSQVRTGTTRYYLLNEGVFDLSKEQLELGKQYNKSFANRKKARKRGKRVKKPE